MLTMKDYPNIFVFNHPLIMHKLTIMRQKETDMETFRRLLKEISLLMGYELTHGLETKEVDIDTPLTRTKGRLLKGKGVAVVPILRAGLGMAEGLMDLMPGACEGHIGLYRDPKTKKPVNHCL